MRLTRKINKKFEALVGDGKLQKAEDLYVALTGGERDEPFVTQLEGDMMRKSLTRGMAAHVG